MNLEEAKKLYMKKDYGKCFDCEHGNVPDIKRKCYCKVVEDYIYKKDNIKSYFKVLFCKYYEKQ